MCGLWRLLGLWDLTVGIFPGPMARSATVKARGVVCGVCWGLGAWLWVFFRVTWPDEPQCGGSGGGSAIGGTKPMCELAMVESMEVWVTALAVLLT